MPPRPKTSGSGRDNTPDLSGAMSATRRLIAALNVAEEGEGSSGTDRGISTASIPPPPYSVLGNSTTHPPVERYVGADGRVGVLISQSHQGSWSTRVRILLDPMDPASVAKARRMEEIALFDREVIENFLDGDIRQAKTIAMAKMGVPSQFCHWFDQVELTIAWVAPGEEFEVANSPGFERVRLKNAIQFWRA